MVGGGFDIMIEKDQLFRKIQDIEAYCQELREITNDNIFDIVEFNLKLEGIKDIIKEANEIAERIDFLSSNT